MLEKFILYHIDSMNKWIDLYAIQMEEVLESKRQIKRLNPRNTPFPTELQGEGGKYFTLEWGSTQI